MKAKWPCLCIVTRHTLNNTHNEWSSLQLQWHLLFYLIQAHRKNKIRYYFHVKRISFILHSILCAKIEKNRPNSNELLTSTQRQLILRRTLCDRPTNIWFESESVQIGNDQLQFLQGICDEFSLGCQSTFARATLSLVITFLGTLGSEGQSFCGGFGEVFGHAPPRFVEG